jgi:hypothetical protein
MPTSVTKLTEWLEVVGDGIDVGDVDAAGTTDGYLKAQIEQPPAPPPLIVGVDDDSRDGPAGARTEQFSFFYVGARNLTTAERAWLDALVERTRRSEQTRH